MSSRFAVALLDKQGKLSLDDDVRKFIPELPDLGKTVTLRHLLSHTSGYREFINFLTLGGLNLNEGDYIGKNEIIEIVQAQPRLQNDPGAEFNYNNTGFSLLATVVERVTKEKFPDWMRENVFKPIGMTHTVIRMHPRQHRVWRDGAEVELSLREFKFLEHLVRLPHDQDVLVTLPHGADGLGRGVVVRVVEEQRVAMELGTRILQHGQQAQTVATGIAV